MKRKKTWNCMLWIVYMCMNEGCNSSNIKIRFIIFDFCLRTCIRIRLERKCQSSYFSSSCLNPSLKIVIQAQIFPPRKKNHLLFCSNEHSTIRQSSPSSLRLRFSSLYQCRIERKAKAGFFSHLFLV